MSKRVPLSWMLYLVIIALAILGLALSEVAPKDSEDVQEVFELSESNLRTHTFQDMLASGGAAIYVEDQAQGALEVEVGFVRLPSPGFVAIHANDEGLPGGIVGMSELLDGEQEYLTIPLKNPLVDQAIYYAVLYADDGNGVFSLPQDQPLSQEDGSTTVMTFTATH